jgi:hypothetical protein
LGVLFDFIGFFAAFTDDAAAACQYCQADCAADDDDKGEA